MPDDRDSREDDEGHSVALDESSTVFTEVTQQYPASSLQ